MALDDFLTRFPEGGDSVVEKVRYSPADERVYINNEQYFEGVPEEVWGFRVGGYRVMDKWLKDRKGRTGFQPPTCATTSASSSPSRRLAASCAR